MKTRIVLAAVWAVVAMACGGQPQPTEQQPGQQPETTQQELVGEQCGNVVCGKGTYCCNASCNQCVPFDMSCTQQVCDTGTVVAPETEEKVAVPETEESVIGATCGDNVCGIGTYCCNPSCGICAPKGGACPDVMCEDPV